MSGRSEVIFCTHDSPTSLGGPFTWLRRLLPALRDKGIDSRVLALTHYGGTGSVVEGLRDDGFEVDAVDCHDRTEDQIRWLVNQIGPNTPSVFVANFVISALFAARWLKEKRVTTVGVLHSDDFYYRAIQDEFLFGAKAFQLSEMVCVSERLTDEVMRKGFKATYIPYGVKVPDRQASLTPHRFRIAYVGRLAEEQKRISLVARALIEASRKIPGVEGIIFGDGPNRGDLLQILAEEGQGANVHWGGPLKHEEVQKTLLDFQAITLLSDYEGLPISLLEGMACGCIGICRNINSGIPQIIETNKTGLLVSDDIQEFVQAVRYLYENREKAANIALAGRQKIREKYSDDVSVDRWYHFLKSHMGLNRQGQISLPRHLRLPAANSQLESLEARRRPDTPFKQRLRRFRILLGALRRRCFAINKK